MFWGLIMEPQRRYTQQVKKAFHISMAALDISTSSGEPSQVMCGFEGRNYLLCTLKKPDMLQCSLDLNFDVGSEVSFAANGSCHVHLTGYLTDEFLNTTEEEKAEGEKKFKNKERNKLSLDNGPPAKKQKKGSQVSSSQGQIIGSDSEESDLDVNILLEKSLPESDEDDSDALEEEEDAEDNEEENSDEDGASSLSEEEVDDVEIAHKQQKIKSNGIPKKRDRNNRDNVQEKEENKNKKPLKGDDRNENKTPNKEKKVNKRTLQGGIIIEDLKEGNGSLAKAGKFVNVYYQGRLKQNNKVFDATTKGNGFSFRLGSGEVIKGWDVGIAGMKIGGKRRIICPPAMAYGQKGSPPAIPPNSTLIFDVELKKVS